MPGKRKKSANLQKKIKSPRLRAAELQKNTPKKKRLETLPKSELLYRTLMENIHFGITFIGADRRIVMTNAGMSRLCKKPESDIIGKYCFREFEKRKTVCPHCPGTQAMATGRPVTVETKGVGDDGNLTAVRIQALPIFEADGTIKGFIEVVEDLTERKKAEEELRQAEAKYKALVEQIPAVTYTAALDKASTTTYVSPQIAKLIGFSPEEYKADPDTWRKQLHPEDRQRVLDSLYLSQKSETPFICEYRMLRKDGRVVWCRDEAVIVRDISGKPLMLQGVMFDTTAAKRAEEALRESEIKIRAIFDQTFQFIGLMNIDGTLIEANRAALEFSGIDSSSVLNKPFWQGPWWTHSPQLQEKLRQSVEKAARGEFIRFEATHVARDGTLHYVDFSLKPVKNETGKVIFLIPEGRDITDRRKAEEELNTYREKMAQTERLASLGTLSATVAHELTQPLTVIRLSIENSLEDLKAASCPKTVINVLKEGLNEVSNATSVVDRFRNYARQSSRKNLCKTNLGTIAGRIIQLLGKTAQRAKMTLHLKGLDKLPPVYSNEKDLEQLFFALTENAIQAADGKKNHRFTIEGVVKDKNIELLFADNCSGIAPENLDKIFDPFFTTSPYDGRTGLGLPIVQRILSEYGGKISVQSRSGKGTTFYVTLPIHSETVK